METEIKRICQELAAFIKERRISKSSISKRANVTRPTLDNLFGEKSPSFEAVLKIANAIGFKIEIVLNLKRDTVAVIQTADNIEFNTPESKPF